ncbi:hypothetical protein [Paenibacillus glycanilyticus]|uniref:Uncharacterized protein n=1 Tax=Paenibacillus glycanilyticus TaxID=126569 RepID=A0ABQ6G8P1_9BACL|nr:hypothetical protein [Paenibacillus glycanilyticus]GLX67288.1 hypothetical protein MU1_16330 [Paenibacillus glycanilyticus]
MAFYYVYSTGPVENAFGIAEPGVATNVFVKALNNGCKRARVVIKLYRLNGTKVLVETRTLSLAARASGFVDLDVSTLLQYEIQITTFSKKVLVSVWGKDADGAPLASQRFTQAELHKTVKKYCKK